MKITVTLTGPSTGSATPTFKGSHVIIATLGVILDGTGVIERDRRMKSNRVDGHPWLSADRQDATAWAGFRVNVDTD